MEEENGMEGSRMLSKEREVVCTPWGRGERTRSESVEKNERDLSSAQESQKGETIQRMKSRGPRQDESDNGRVLFVA